MLEVLAPLTPHALDAQIWPGGRAPIVSEAMSRSLVTIGPEISVEGARRTGASRDVHHMIVVAPVENRFGTRATPTWLARFGGGRIDAASVLGIVCRPDLDAWPANATVRQAMTYPVLCISVEMTLGAAAGIMRERSVGALLVQGGSAVFGGTTVLGILTRQDLRRVGLPEEAFTGARCASCDGKRRVRWDARTGGFASCCACRSIARSTPPDTEIGTGD